ncbi:beta-lactamase family protein [Sphingomonas sp. NBWT7]|uniref:serine hydrolase domain-containing protein n=1 Tax=Sphingomonas sp. NBWT7 TaxID=2596913 RepID=UPI0016247733|nr:serine hydrolase domain-containing protein [Sphingomonas sp. NBWT7]QNE32438.1 beta-lactamase family protein [Sphingomonas sp. NBWT7]
MTIQQALDAAVASGKIAGAVAMVGNRAGTLDAAASGLRDPASGAAMTPDAIFQLASMTKAIVSVAAMQLVERGALSLEAPIGSVLPGLADPQVIDGFGDDGVVRLRPAKAPITLRHLLTHTSGLGYAFMNADMARAQGAVAPGSLASLHLPLLFDPGERWEYGISTDWVGLAVEAATGRRLGEVLAEEIFVPLGMTDTGFTMDAAQTARRVALLARGTDGTLSPFPIEIGGGEAAEYQSGGGGLLGTAADYLRFARMLLNAGELDGVRILKPGTVAEMTRDQIAPLRAGALRSIMPQFALDYDAYPDMHSGFGLGFLLNPEPGPDGRGAGSLMWDGVANTYFWIDPARDRAGVVMMQFAPFADPAALALVSAVERAVYQAA